MYLTLSLVCLAWGIINTIARYSGGGSRMLHALVTVRVRDLIGIVFFLLTLLPAPESKLKNPEHDYEA